MARKQKPDLFELAKQAKAPGPLLLAVLGVYGGQYAKLFDKPFSDVASIICLIAMAVGVLLLAISATRATFSK
jgi:hypothetical protein